MGYQESFITTKKSELFNDFVKRIQTIGIKYYDYYGARPKLIITVKKDIHGLYDKKIMLKSGRQYVYFTGDRGLQRYPSAILNVLNKNEFSDNENFKDTMLLKQPFLLEGVFAEEIDCKKIFDVTKHEDGEIYDGLNNEWIEVSRFKFDEITELDFHFQSEDPDMGIQNEGVCCNGMEDIMRRIPIITTADLTSSS